jgi:hypothetical protein
MWLIRFGIRTSGEGLGEICAEVVDAMVEHRRASAAARAIAGQARDGGVDRHRWVRAETMRCATPLMWRWQRVRLEAA